VRIEIDSASTPTRDELAPLTSEQKETLERAVEKVVALAAGVGVSADEIIELLKSGLTVRELLEYIGAHYGWIA
jgi:DNA-binding transcriptional regulator YhcF (GntR family)